MELFKRKPLAGMDARELRKAELLAGGEQKRLTRQITGLASQKQAIFEQGSKTKSPKLRRTLAQQFELLTTQEMIVGRTLNMATKETMIIGRLLTAKTHGGRENLVHKQDIAGLQRAMDKDAAAAAAYHAMLDDALAGMEVAEGETGLSEAGGAVLLGRDGCRRGEARRSDGRGRPRHSRQDSGQPTRVAL